MSPDIGGAASADFLAKSASSACFPYHGPPAQHHSLTSFSCSAQQFSRPRPLPNTVYTLVGPQICQCLVDPDGGRLGWCTHEVKRAAPNMNRGSKHLVPIAPRPSSAVSLDPRDYCYPSEQNFVWGVPQADHLQSQPTGMMQHHVGAYMMPHQGMYGNQHAAGSWGQPGFWWSQPHMLPSPGEGKGSSPLGGPMETHWLVNRCAMAR